MTDYLNKSVVIKEEPHNVEEAAMDTDAEAVDIIKCIEWGIGS